MIDNINNIVLVHVKGGGLNSASMDHALGAKEFAICMDPYLYREDIMEEKLMAEFLVMVDLDWEEKSGDCMLSIATADELIAQTTDSVRYGHQCENALMKNGQPVFCMRKDPSTGVFAPSFCCMHLSNNLEARREMEGIYAAIDRAIAQAEAMEEKDDRATDSESDEDATKSQRKKKKEPTEQEKLLKELGRKVYCIVWFVLYLGKQVSILGQCPSTILRCIGCLLKTGKFSS